MAFARDVTSRVQAAWGTACFTSTPNSACPGKVGPGPDPHKLLEEKTTKNPKSKSVKIVVERIAIYTEEEVIRNCFSPVSVC